VSRADAGALWTETLKSDRTADNEAEAIIANCAVFSPNGSRLAVGGGDGVRILDAFSKRARNTGFRQWRSHRTAAL
jgi:hypothetical protein